MHLAVELPAYGGYGPDSHTGDPRPDFDTYARLARTAERGLFDFLLLTDHHPSASDPLAASAAVSSVRHALDPFTVLNALAAVTRHIGLAAAVTASGREPYDLARRIAALDQLSGGRAAGPASLVPAFTLPRSPQGRPVALRDADQLAPFAYPTDGTAGVAPDVVIIGAPTTRGSTHSHALVLARLDWRPDTSDALGDSGAPDALSFPPATRQTAPREQPGAGETFAESAAALAARLDSLVRSGTVDGFVLRPAPEPGGRGLDPFVDGVVPLLQERGTLRTAYRGTTLREHLELPRPAWKG